MLKTNYIQVDVSDSENDLENDLEIDNIDYTKKIHELCNINLDLEMRLKNENEKYKNFIFYSFLIGFTSGFILSQTIN